MEIIYTSTNEENRKFQKLVSSHLTSLHFLLNESENEELLLQTRY